MATEVKLPRLGQGMESGTIVRWLKTEGDAVAKGEPLYELDTDKVTQEVEAEADGVLLKIVVADGEVDVGTTVGVIGAQDEDVSALLADAQAATATRRPRRRHRRGGGEPHGRGRGSRATEPASRATAPSPRSRRRQAPCRPPRSPQRTGERVKASPLARRIARERGVDLAPIAGTGPEGRVIAEDVEKAAARPAAAPQRAPAAAPRDVEVVELTSTRQTIARRLTEAWQAPVFQLTVTADATELVATRERMVELAARGRGEADGQRRAHAARRVGARAPPPGQRELRRRQAPSLLRGERRHRGRGAERPRRPGHPRRRPQVGAGDRRRSRRHRRRARATASSSSPISRAGRSRSRTSGCTASSSSSPSSTRRRSRSSRSARSRIGPSAIDGDLAIVPTMTMTLTCDHRAIDGSEGAEFLRDVKAFVETPALAL